MPSKKQRRRRQKERRHEYEYVYVDEEGRELDPTDVPAVEKPATERPTTTARKATPARSRDGRKSASGAIRPVPPPSWKRVAKRGAIFAPFMLLAISLLGKGISWPARIAETLWLMLLFVPFSYMVDRMMYRRYLKQTGQPLPPTRQRRA